MRTATLLLTPMFALALAACGDDKSDTDTAGSTTNNTTGVTTTDPTATTEPATTDPTATTEPATTEPATTEPATTEPATTGPATATNPTTGMTTDGTTDATTDGSSSTGDVTGDPVDLTCENYCSLYATACKDFSEYANDEECLAQCAQWPVGQPNETAGDSLGCRTYHVEVAGMADAKLHCPHAGPTGDGVCVSADAPTCDDYCTTYFANCKAKLNLYTDMADCTDQCSEWYPGIKDATAGDSVGCREYHAGVAIGDPDTHCPHAGPGGADVCVTP